MEALAVIASVCAGNGRLFATIERASALAQIGFRGWQKSVLATAAQINFGGLLAQSTIVLLPERNRVA
jgi:hypothetical protein